MGQTKVLHTKSSYFEGSYLKGSGERKEYFLPSKIRADFQEAEDYALKQERKFYQYFFPEVTNFDEFIAKMREIFDKAKEDSQRINRLANVNLKSFIGTNGSISIEEELQYEIIVENDSKKISFEGLNTKNSTISGKNFINISTNLPEAKEIANYIRKDPEINKYLQTNPGKFDLGSSSSKNITEWFKKELNYPFLKAGESAIKELGESGVALKITNTEGQKRTSSTGFFKLAEELPIFSLKASDIKVLINDPKVKAQILQQLGTAIEALKDYILNDILDIEGGCIINGVNILKEAAMMAWRNTLSSKLNGDPLFFFVGGNFVNGLQGKMGEFQLDLLNKYTAITTNKTNPKLGNIIGGIAKGSRGQPRSDYQLIVELGGDIGTLIAGFQVKNYGRAQMSTVEINSDLGLIAPNLGTGFSDSLANVQFNKDIYSKTPDMETFIEKFLNKYFWKAMNLNIGDNLDPVHTNTFYWAGGTAIMPASKIIQTIYNNKSITNPTFKIDNFSSPIADDSGFLNLNDKGDPLFTTYWSGNKNAGWTVTSSNTELYEKLLTDIKVHTKFSLLSIFNANGGIENFEFF